MHGSKEEWSRLIWTADIAALPRDGETLDWTAILAEADHAGVRRMLLTGTALAGSMLGARRADPWVRRLARATARQAFRCLLRTFIKPALFRPWRPSI